MLNDTFKEYAREALGPEIAEKLFKEIETGNEQVSIRVNPFKKTNRELEDFLNEQNLGFSPVLWSSLGYYLNQRPVFTLDPCFHQGAYYVQEASSMYMQIVEQSINNVQPNFFKSTISALDLCAAPGGKTTHLASLISEDSLLVANEVIKSRAVVLADNVAKWGRDNIVVSNNDPANFKDFKEFFNLIVVDAPCSGEGLFRKDSDAIEQWSSDNVNLCAQRQQRILANIWECLQEGGFLVYSTCTYNKFENDCNIEFLVNNYNASVVNLVFPCNSGIITTKKSGAQFVPGQLRGEGQFMAVIRKMGGGNNASISQRKDKKSNSKQVFDKSCNYLGDDYLKVLQADLVKAYNKSLYERIVFVEGKLRCLLSGIAIATKKGKDYIPHADLALSCAFNNMLKENSLPASISSYTVDKDTALKFLAKEAIVLKDAPVGYILLVYKGLGLGFVKNLGNRTNNLLPMARRIRMDIK